MDSVKLNFKYSLLQGLFWSYFCPVVAFATIYFVSLGLNTMEIGLITSAANILSVILQPIVAGLADRSKKISLKGITVFLIILSVIPLILINILRPKLILAVILYSLSCIVLLTLQPLINSFGVYYLNLGYKLNFGISRAVGSAMFALVSSILGVLLKKYGFFSKDLISYLFFLLTLLIIWSFNMEEKKDPNLMIFNKGIKNKGLAQFLKEHLAFVVVLVGVFFIFSNHNMANTYMMQIMENIGGDEESVGIAFAIAALAEVPLMVYSDRFIKRYGSKNFLTFSMVFWVIKALAMALTLNVGLMFLVMTIQAFGYAPFIPGSVHYTNEVMDGGEKYFGQALMTASNTLGAVLGNISGGIILLRHGASGLLSLSLFFALLGGTIVVIGLRMVDSKNKIQ